MGAVIALPIGHHAGLRQLMGRFEQSLLNETNPRIVGLDQSVLVPPRRLHFTLGVMSLASTRSVAGPVEATDPTNQTRTIDDAIRFLESLKPRVDELLRVSVSGSANRAQKIRVPLNSMDVMNLEKEGAAHVLWVGPKHENLRDAADKEADKFKQVCEFIHSSFKRAGFLVEEGRPLKLHCTVINTVYRKPRPQGGKRIPFAYPDILASSWFSRPEILTPPQKLTSQRPTQGVGRHPPRGSVSVDFGTWGVDEVQICEMGSHGPEGEYVCVGKIAV